MLGAGRRRPASSRRRSRAHEVFAARRRALSKLFPAETLIIPTGHEKVRANDTHYRFRPGSDFFYLTGNLEPDCVLVLQPQEGGGHRDILFVEPNPGRSDTTFFTDRVKGELWVGPRLGVEQSRAHFAVDECRGLPELDAYLSGLVGTVTRPHRVLRGMSERVDKLLAKHDRDKQLGEALSEMRLLKDALEVQELEAVVASTKRGFEDVIRALPARGASERSRASSTCAPGSRATTSATGPSPRRATTRARCTGRGTTARWSRASSSWSTPASRATRSTRPTSPGPCRSTGSSPGSSARSTSSCSRRRRRRSAR